MRLVLLSGVVLARLALCQPAVVIDSGSMSDTYFSGGATTVIQNPPPNVVDSTARYGNFSYQIPASTAPYVLTLNWVEQTVGGPGQRLFQVRVNDQVIFDNLDLFTSCGFMTPCSRSIVVVPSGGFVNVVFKTEVRNAIVSGLSLVPLFASTAMGQLGLATVKVSASTVPGFYLVSVPQVDGNIKQYVALVATPEDIAAQVWQ